MIIAGILLIVLVGWSAMAIGVKHHLDEMDEMDRAEKEPTEYDDAYNDWYAKQYGVEKWEEKK